MHTIKFAHEEHESKRKQNINSHIVRYITSTISWHSHTHNPHTHAHVASRNNMTHLNFCPPSAPPDLWLCGQWLTECVPVSVCAWSEKTVKDDLLSAFFHTTSVPCLFDGSLHVRNVCLSCLLTSMCCSTLSAGSEEVIKYIVGAELSYTIQSSCRVLTINWQSLHTELNWNIFSAHNNLQQKKTCSFNKDSFFPLTLFYRVFTLSTYSIVWMIQETHESFRICQL